VSSARTAGVSSERLLFPAAALFAIAAVPAWLAALGGWIPAPGPHWHAHEMLFGYALAVVAGYLLTRVSLATLTVLFVAWLAARVAPFVAAHGSATVIVPNLLFAVLVAWQAAPPFLRAAKKPENRVLGPLFIAFAAGEALYQLGASGLVTGLEAPALLFALDLFTLLMLMMGGRVIPPAVAGHFYRRGQFLEARVQPRLERAVILLMIATTVLDPIRAAWPLVGLLALATAAVTALRLWRWRLWEVLDQPNLWALGLAYFWLIPGLALKGIAQVSGALPLNEALHGITVGALGTLTLVMMARTRLQRSRVGLERFGDRTEPRAARQGWRDGGFGDIGVAAVLVGVAALLRIAAPLAGGGFYMLLLWSSAGAWVAAFAVLLFRLLSLRVRGRSPAADRCPASGPTSPSPR
jgi:uncharacterized protein involved in response to NO